MSPQIRAAKTLCSLYIHSKPRHFTKAGIFSQLEYYKSDLRVLLRYGYHIRGERGGVLNRFSTALDEPHSRVV